MAQVRRLGKLILAAGVVLAPATASSQSPPLPPAPVPVNPEAVGPAPPALGRPIPVPPPTAPVPVVPPGPLAPVPPPPPPAPLFPPDPSKDGWWPIGLPSLDDALFFDAQILVTRPSLNNRLAPDTPLVSGTTHLVPSTNLSWTVSPTFELGYRLPDSQGLFALNYRFLVSEGTGTQTVGAESFAVRTRLNANIVDIDYGTTPYSPLPRYDISWRLGARVADIFFDSAAVNPLHQLQSSNDYFGAGPHGRFEVERHIIALPGLSLFGRLDGAVLIGQVSQHHREILTTGDTTTDVFLIQRRTQSVPILNLQAGISYIPPFLKNVVFTTGYEWERYWALGRIGVSADGSLPRSHAELTSQGWFLRGQIDF
jgi:hypothetical protein